MNNRKKVVISILGISKDAKGGHTEKRWSQWRPTVSVVMHKEFPVDRLELIYHPQHLSKALLVSEDIRAVSPDTEVSLIEAVWDNPWDFAEIYNWFYEFARHYPVNTDDESYYLNITTGTHVSQICMFLMSEAHLLPAQILQVSPVTQSAKKAEGSLHSIDLDLARYDVMAKRYFEESSTGQDFLKSGIQTRNSHFNGMIAEIERVALRSKDPILLEGPTGAGKTQLARKIYELKTIRKTTKGSFVLLTVPP